jgi:hypothetical protein
MESSYLIGNFEPDPGLQTAFEIWTRYYEQTEMFDRFHCAHRSPRTGNAIPISHYERQVCTRNAIEQREITKRRLAEAGIGEDISRRAQRMAM